MHMYRFRITDRKYTLVRYFLFGIGRQFHKNSQKSKMKNAKKVVSLFFVGILDLVGRQI